MSTRCCARRCAARPSRTPSARWRRRPASRASRSIGARSRSPRTAAMTTDRPAPTTISRQAAFRTGVSAESRAAAYLVGRGYAIAARRWPELLFVEVKARHRLDDAALSVTPRQQRRIVAAAEAWLADHPDDGTCEIRFDVILVARSGRTQHITAAFDASP